MRKMVQSSGVRYWPWEKLLPQKNHLHAPSRILPGPPGPPPRGTAAAPRRAALPRCKRQSDGLSLPGSTGAASSHHHCYCRDLGPPLPPPPGGYPGRPHEMDPQQQHFNDHQWVRTVRAQLPSWSGGVDLVEVVSKGPVDIGPGDCPIEP